MQKGDDPLGGTTKGKYLLGRSVLGFEEEE